MRARPANPDYGAPKGHRPTFGVQRPPAATADNLKSSAVTIRADRQTTVGRIRPELSTDAVAHRRHQHRHGFGEALELELFGVGFFGLRSRHRRLPAQGQARPLPPSSSSRRPTTSTKSKAPRSTGALRPSSAATLTSSRTSAAASTPKVNGKSSETRVRTTSTRSRGSPSRNGPTAISPRWAAPRPPSGSSPWPPWTTPRTRR